MASPPSLPLCSPDERFNKAKKHLWASENPASEENNTSRFAEGQEHDMKSPSPENIRMHTSHSATPQQPRSPKMTEKSQASECILKGPSNRPQHVLPPLPREGFNFDHDRRLPLPRSWSMTERTSPSDRPISRPIASTSQTSTRINNETLQRPVSLSVFNSPTATYMWPGFQAASQMSHPPIIYVNYDITDPMRSTSSGSVSSVHDSPVMSSPALTRHDRFATNMLPRKRRSPSPERRGPPERGTSSRNMTQSMSRTQLSDRVHYPLSAQSYRQQDRYSQLNQPFNPTLARAGSVHNSATSSEDDQLRSSHEGSPRISEASEEERVVRPIVRRPSPRADVADTWERYAKPTLSPDGTTRKWQCTWPTPEDRKKPTCEYTSKKQLVKRHVETTHLRYKPFICEVCKKGFPQKTSLDTHMHGHTGSTPHVCRYGCGMAFKDPARRHRHMVEEHGYIPRQSKKKHKADPTPQGTTADPVRPLTFIGGSDE